MPSRIQSAVTLFACACISASGPGRCLAQLAPDRAFYGIDRAVPMSVRLPAAAVDAPKDGALAAEVQIMDPRTLERITKVPVRLPAADAAGSGGVERLSLDLASLVPNFWKLLSDRGGGGDVLRAQLVVGGRGVGPSVVLQPMLSPVYAPRADRSGAPMFPPEKERVRVFSGVRAYVDQDVALETSKGRIVISLRPEAAPVTCWRFRELVQGGFYTDVVVHRIASLAGKPEADIIQTGDPNGNGQGGCGEFLDLEPSPLPHDFGVVSMARFGDPNSASSQFMICLNREGTAYLDKRYASFAVVIAGADVLRAIAATPVGPDNRPKDPPLIRSAMLVDAAPFGTGPLPERDPAKREGR